MPKATWRGQTIAEATDNAVISLEGNIYFPYSALNRDFFRNSTKTTKCPWKGIAHYYDVVVDGQTNHDAAWTYHTPSDAAKNIKDFVAFWHGVDIT